MVQSKNEKINCTTVVSYGTFLIRILPEISLFLINLNAMRLINAPLRAISYTVASRLYKNTRAADFPPVLTVVG